MRRKDELAGADDNSVRDSFRKSIRSNFTRASMVDLDKE